MGEKLTGEKNLFMATSIKDIQPFTIPTAALTASGSRV